METVMVQEELVPQLKEGEPKKRQSVSALLRVIGAIVLLASAATFMLQQWSGHDHIFRYFSFLGFTLLLSAAGFICGIGMKEDKGARTLLAVSAAIVPVHFCQLGALVYSRFILPGMHHYPAYLTWVAPDTFSATLSTLIGIAVLIPITFVSFSSLVRAHARELTVAYLVSNAVLLIPSRAPDCMALVGFLLFMGIVYFDRGFLAHKAPMRTREGFFVRLMLVVPYLVLVGRNVHLYDMSAFFVSMVLASIAVFHFVFAPQYTESRTAKRFLQAVSTFPALGAWLCFASEVFKGAPQEAMLPLMTIPFAMLLVLMSFHAVGDGRRYRTAGALIAMGGMLMNLLEYEGSFVSFGCIAMGVLITAYGHAVEEKGVFLSGIAGLGFGLLYHLQYAVELCTFSPWVSLAVLGIGTVVASSYIERNCSRLMKQVEAFRVEFKRWR